MGLPANEHLCTSLRTKACGSNAMFQSVPANSMSSMGLDSTGGLFRCLLLCGFHACGDVQFHFLHVIARFLFYALFSGVMNFRRWQVHATRADGRLPDLLMPASVQSIGAL